MAYAPPVDLPRGRSRSVRVPIVRGTAKSMLRMCAREQLGNDLKRAMRDLVCDENFDESAATGCRLDFDILVSES